MQPARADRGAVCDCSNVKRRDAVDRARLRKLADDDGEAEALGVHDVLDALIEFPSARPRIGDFAAALGAYAAAPLLDRQLAAQASAPKCT